jgi:hypothetical protein
MPSSTNNKQTASHVIESWWQRLGAAGYVCMAVGKNRSLFFQQESVDVERFIRTHQDEHLFFCPHPFAPRPLLCRKIENSVACRGLWADLDAVDPRKLGALKPTIAIETSLRRFAGLWLTDGVAEVSLNKRLTYHLGADRGGWCFTKLLRLPGSRNHKYRPAPLVRVLWDDGPTHRIAALERLLPKAPAPHAHRGREGGFKERAFTFSPGGPGVKPGVYRPKVYGSEPEQILAQYNIRDSLRRELLHGQPNGEDRSRALWKFACELRDRGVPADESSVVLMSSAWSRGRDDDVERVISKIWGE